ncbi:MAG: DUF4112 domain-containing protein [Beijerinckiaceae bacterium]
MSTSFSRQWYADGAGTHAGFAPHVSASARETRAREERALARLMLIARVMDAAVTIPGVNLRVGVDAALGLVPAVGDMIAGAIASWIVFEARRLGAPPLLIARMVANVVVDTVVGAVPFLGDAFDVGFKANLRNVALLRRHLDRRNSIDGEVVGQG